MPHELRWGYSTGACAAAVAVGAWRYVVDGTTPTSVELLFPDKEYRTLPLIAEGAGMANIRKDGGDDPDCTHNALIWGRLVPATQASALPQDYCLPVCDGTVILRAGEGIGLCTRIGLDCECGKWAINVVPRHMIAENLSRAGLQQGCWLLTIGIENGLALAAKTLNAQLGITGGLSLLGTSGMVRPYSHEAYVATIRLCVRSHALSKGQHMVFCTGGRTRRGAEGYLSHLPETAFVCIGDYISESLTTAGKHQMKEVTLACMPGKLCKYAAGFTNTHAHTVAQDMSLMVTVVKSVLSDKDIPDHIHTAVSVREALEMLPDTKRLPVLQALARRAHEALLTIYPQGRLQLLVCDFTGTPLFCFE